VTFVDTCLGIRFGRKNNYFHLHKLLLFQCKAELLTSVTSDDGSVQTQKCPYFLPFESQGWPSFMGIQGDSTYNPRAEMKQRQKVKKDNR